MVELISIRVALFFVAFFGLRPLMFLLIDRPHRAHALGLLGVSTLIAFVTSSLILDEAMGDTLLAWFVIYAIIAGLWFARWKGQEYEKVRRPPRDETRVRAQDEGAD